MCSDIQGFMKPPKAQLVLLDGRRQKTHTEPSPDLEVQRGKVLGEVYLLASELPLKDLEQLYNLLRRGSITHRFSA